MKTLFFRISSRDFNFELLINVIKLYLELTFNFSKHTKAGNNSSISITQNNIKDNALNKMYEYRENNILKVKLNKSYLFLVDLLHECSLHVFSIVKNIFNIISNTISIPFLLKFNRKELCLFIEWRLFIFNSLVKFNN